MFSAIEARLNLDYIRVLDLFAGSGQLGIEALSRGANYCVFVEQQRRTAGIIRENLALCGLQDRSKVFPTRVQVALNVLGRENSSPFDLVLLDPPYKDVPHLWPEIFQSLVKNKLLRAGALIVMEHDKEFEGMDFVTDLKLLKRCQYGNAMLSFSIYTPL